MIAAGRILLIEDDERVSALICRTLSDQGFVVTAASTGPAGLAAAQSEDYDLVILDLMLPGMSGMVVLGDLVMARATPPVLVLSAVPDIATRVACLELGAADFLSKPFALAELLARVRSRLRGAGNHQVATVLEVGGVQLDLLLHRVRVADRSSSLPDREFLLLRYLMLRADLACSREDLLRDVWGMKFDPGTNVVDVYVRRLRAKLDRADRIVAERSVGYRFVSS
jgi:DNA-binding response OmpR family regulator